MGKFVCILTLIILTVIYQSMADITDTTCDPNDNGDGTCQTVDENSVCPADTSNCACKADFFFSTDKTKCEQKITTVDCISGHNTDGDTKCQLVDNISECPASNKCSCKDGYTGIDFCTNIITDITCIPNDGTCQVVDTNAECPTGSSTCKCKANHFLSFDKKQCVQSIEEITCTPEHASDGNTKCQSEDLNTECPTGSLTCKCKADHFLSFDKKQCVQSIAEITCTPDDPGNTKCENQNINTECPTGSTTCKCKAEHFLSSDGKQCVQSIEEITCTPGDDGDTKCDTQATNAECPTGSSTCKCKAEYYLSSDKKICKQKITTVTCTPAHATDGNTKCQLVDANSECKTSGTKCTCKAGYTGPDSCTKVLDGPCTSPDDCTGSVANSVCTAQKCECAANFIEESDICKTGLGKACKDDDICVLNAECVDEECKCSSGFKDTDGLCAAESSATSAWTTTSLFVTSMLIYLPRFILW